jgi:spore maturation protein CgeB
MRLLTVASLWPGSTTLERARIMEGLGITIVPFDVTPYHNDFNRLEQTVASRLNFGRGISKLNADLEAMARTHAFDAVWVTKGNWVYPETVAAIRAASTRKLAIHHTNDAIVYNRYGSRHFFKSIPHYDLFVTTKPWEAELYRQQGARDVFVVLHAHGSQFMPCHPDTLTDPALTSDISFIGHCEPHYVEQIRALSRMAAQTGANLKVWGPRWPRYAARNAWAKPLVQSEGLWGESYPRALASSKIALGLLNKKMPETSTSRTFEIPAMGVFMLAERTDELQSLYREGVDAEFFSNTDELCDKARYYLAHDAERQKIAAAGRERCVKGGYSAKSQMQRVFAYIAERYGMTLPEQFPLTA